MEELVSIIKEYPIKRGELSLIKYIVQDHTGYYKEFTDNVGAMEMYGFRGLLAITKYRHLLQPTFAQYKSIDRLMIVDIFHNPSWRDLEQYLSKVGVHRGCPKCGQTMNFVVDMMQCWGCGYSENAHATYVRETGYVDHNELELEIFKSVMRAFDALLAVDPTSVVRDDTRYYTKNKSMRSYLAKLIA